MTKHDCVHTLSCLKFVGAAPNTEEDQHDPQTGNDDIMHPNDVTYMSRF